jgi:hypothetical protein
MYSVDTPDDVSSVIETMDDQDVSLLLSMLAVKKGSATQRQLARVSQLLKHQAGRVK